VSNVPAPGLASSPAWVRFDFHAPRQIGGLLVWNENQSGASECANPEMMTRRGMRKVHIYGSTDGVRVKWSPLTLTEVVELPQASAEAYEPPFRIDAKAGGAAVKSVIIAADPVDGNYGSDYYGLSAVRFVER